MMLDLQKHMERDSALDLVAQRARDVVGTVAKAVHRPHREKCGHTLIDGHRTHVIAKQAAAEADEVERDPHRIQKQLACDRCTQLPISIPKRRQLQQDRKGWTKHEGAPRWHIRVPAFHLAFARREFMVSQVVELHGVH